MLTPEAPIPESTPFAYHRAVTTSTNPASYAGVSAKPLILIGGGVMGSAILSRALAAGMFEPQRTLVIEPDSTKAQLFVQQGLCVAASLNAAEPMRTSTALPPSGSSDLSRSGVVVLAVKPQVFDTIAADINRLLRPDDLVVSIMAGVRLDTLRTRLGIDQIVRAMPSTPARIGMSVTAITAPPSVSTANVESARSLLLTIGPTLIPIDESLMDAFTALAGSGPAYVFYLAEALMAAARTAGFNAAQSDEIVRATLRSSAELLNGSPQSPAELRAAVTSKNGTTQAACEVLDAHGVSKSIIEAVIAGRNRSRELGA